MNDRFIRFKNDDSSKLISKLYNRNASGVKPEKMQTNPDIIPTKQTAKERLNDIGFRVILIPFFGIVIPILTGMIDNKVYRLWQLKLGYLYTIAIAFIVW